MNQLIDGKAIAKNVYDALKQRLVACQTNYNITPGLAIILVGDDESAKVYVNMIISRCQKIGMPAELFEFAADVKTEQVIKTIEDLNNNSQYAGIIVQLPLPKEQDETRVREAISPDKDVDCAGSRNIGKFYSGRDCFKPCTPKSMLKLLKSTEQPLVGKKAVVVGRSHVVGKPIAHMLLDENMTVTICHSRTADLAAEVKHADVVMAAVGKRGIIDVQMIKPDAIVIDAGINVVDGKVYGDVNFEGMLDKVKAITPVPGGVGPLTIAMLIENVLDACERQLAKVQS